MKACGAGQTRDHPNTKVELDRTHPMPRPEHRAASTGLEPTREKEQGTASDNLAQDPGQ